MRTASFGSLGPAFIPLPLECLRRLINLPVPRQFDKADAVRQCPSQGICDGHGDFCLTDPCGSHDCDEVILRHPTSMGMVSDSPLPTIREVAAENWCG